MRDDRIIRLGILDELRRDLVKGPAFTEMSYLLRAFIAFLELAPVLAKIFFAPPTVYSARVRAAVVQGQSRALREASVPFGVIDLYGINEPTNAGLLAADSGGHRPARLDNPPNADARDTARKACSRTAAALELWRHRPACRVAACRMDRRGSRPQARRRGLLCGQAG